ncbi:baseplate assembly protein [Hylemonella gracilis str. Niagara R]|uniref:Baseplate assembly protein n=1 Tax=Hylemonella gracilis str. Niagara R TaxID=1458275 RepID=A0A016XHY4_9BURK|nr:baseplate assembly protein [Hylemonella gracilis str. Niagara R]
MIGMDARTGRALTGAARLAQSALDVLLTPIGSRLGRRSYGSRWPELIDAPDNDATRLRLYAAAADALMRELPELTVERITLTRPRAGQAVLELQGHDADGQDVSTSLPIDALGGFFA